MRFSHPDLSRRGRGARDPAGSDSLAAAFDRTLIRDPARPLLYRAGADSRADTGPSQTLTVEDLDGLARLAATAFADAPIEPGEVVSFHSPDGPGFLAGLLALLRAGAAPVLLDAHTPPAERVRIGSALGAQRSFSCDCAWPNARTAHWRLTTAEPSPDAARRRTAQPPGTVIKLTSGSSGAPRGILAPGGCLLADEEALTASMGIEPDDRLLAAIPLSHSYGLSSLVVPALARGQQLVLPGPGGPLAPLHAAAAAAATVFPTVPAYLGGLVRLAEPPPLAASLRLVLTAGAPLDADTSSRFNRRYGQPVHVFYGSSESGGICYDREGGAAERGTVGAPVEGVEVEIAAAAGDGDDGDGGRGPAGGGRVSVRSAAVSRGYLPADDARLSGGRFLTEDLAVWRGGELALCGRLGDVINVRGKKVNPREVEEVLRRLPAVDDVAVLAGRVAPGERSGPGGGAHVRAVIACRSGALTREGVVTWCREHLADHKRPRHVLLVERLPRTERGKLDRAALGRLAVDDG